MKKNVKIIATVGPNTLNGDTMKKIVPIIDFARLNFSWGSHEQKLNFLEIIREESKKTGSTVQIMGDLSGPRVQENSGHHINQYAIEVITPKDIDDLKFCLENGVDTIAMSFVGSSADIKKLRKVMSDLGKVLPIVAKVERKVALEKIDEIIKEADAIMIARGDLGNEIPIERIPYEERIIIEKCNEAKKPVYVATQMMLSMTEHPVPTRAEVTDVAYAIMLGADAVMLSEESASGKYPVEAVTEMRRIIDEVASE